MNTTTRRCAFCTQRHHIDDFVRNGASYRWCRFCANRYQKIYGLFMSVGMIPPTKSQLHRAWRVWRTSPEMDALYPPFEGDESRAA